VLHSLFSGIGHVGQGKMHIGLAARILCGFGASQCISRGFPRLKSGTSLCVGGGTSQSCSPSVLSSAEMLKQQDCASGRGQRFPQIPCYSRSGGHPREVRGLLKDGTSPRSVLHSAPKAEQSCTGIGRRVSDGAINSGNARPFLVVGGDETRQLLRLPGAVWITKCQLG
jgi:hypothetical protein